ncbi:hypothetical protein BGZ95_001142 [Linnemannia exigua]|uniref:Uncharacterized protein n=1 Tax=Linnemannia exigua TaxID=604196 RepID=A0AAD4D7M3_9FUNG|nr:hypothetical protein BGZ95_001142 [Linnemannia exigua]
MISIIPLFSLALTLATSALGQSNGKTNLKFCQDSAHKNYFESKTPPVGNSTVPSFTGSPNKEFCFEFGVKLVKEGSFPDETRVGITVYSDQDLIWNDNQPLCNVYTKAPASICSTSTNDPKTDESIISGCISLGTTELKNPRVEGTKGTVYVDFYNSEGLSFVCASGPVKFI